MASNIGYIAAFLGILFLVIPIYELAGNKQYKGMKRLTLTGWILLSLSVLFFLFTFYAFSSFTGRHNTVVHNTSTEVNPASVTVAQPVRQPLQWDIKGQVYHFPDGVIDFQRLAVTAFNTYPVKIWTENGQVLINMILFDSTGSITAELQRNEWTNNPAAAFDRNFDKGAIEIVNREGYPVCQVEINKNQVSLHGLFYNHAGDRLLVQNMNAGNGRKTTWYVPYGRGGLSGSPDAVMLSTLKPIFKYPSASYQGQRMR